jgi:hypothetical protein
MPAIEINVLEPVMNSLSTPEGWIGLLLGLGGRETIQYVKSLLNSLRSTQK